MAAPKGNKNASNARKAKQALDLALSAHENPGKNIASGMVALVNIWSKQIEKALEGDNASASMIVDRLDGKPKQALVGGDEDDSPISVSSAIQFVPVGNESTNKG